MGVMLMSSRLLVSDWSVFGVRWGVPMGVIIFYANEAPDGGYVNELPPARL